MIAALRAIATSGRPSTDDPGEDVRFESFLEARFYRLLAEAGLPLPKAQEIVRSSDGRYILRADFRYEETPLVILTDGRAYHAATRGQIVRDLEIRNKLELDGKRLVEFTYDDVVQNPEAVIRAVQHGLGRAEIEGTVEVDERHTGPKVERDREIAAFRRTFETAQGLRQNHVQVAENNNTIAIYAHTEPHTDAFIDHAISAIFDGASFQGGSKMLKNDLADEGVELVSHSEAAAAARAEFVRRGSR